MEKPIRSFLLWFIQNVVVPLLPLVISVAIDYFLTLPQHVWTDETVLVYAFVLPVLYMGDSRDPFANYGIFGISLVGILFYSAVHIHSHNQLPTLRTGLIYHLALILDMLCIITACTYEIYKRRSSHNRPIG